MVILSGWVRKATTAAPAHVRAPEGPGAAMSDSRRSSRGSSLSRSKNSTNGGARRAAGVRRASTPKSSAPKSSAPKPSGKAPAPKSTSRTGRRAGTPAPPVPLRAARARRRGPPRRTGRAPARGRVAHRPHLGPGPSRRRRLGRRRAEGPREEGRRHQLPELSPRREEEPLALVPLPEADRRRDGADGAGRPRLRRVAVQRHRGARALGLRPGPDLAASTTPTARPRWGSSARSTAPSCRPTRSPTTSSRQWSPARTTASTRTAASPRAASCVPWSTT